MKQYKLYLKNEGNITGIILNQHRKPFNFISVRLTYLDGSIGPNFANRYYTGTNKSGGFEINHIPYGKFLLNVLERKISAGIDKRTALETIYGVELDQKNVEECQFNLCQNDPALKSIVERNIVCADALKYNYNFN